jgi:hypothetical protein
MITHPFTPEKYFNAFWNIKPNLTTSFTDLCLSQTIDIDKFSPSAYDGN